MPDTTWQQGDPIVTGDDYVASLRDRDLDVYLMGERIAEPVDHPIVRPSVNALAATYDLAVDDPDLATAESPFTGERVNRFLHVTESAADVVAQNLMQRRLGQLTGTCFQRCVGMDGINAVFSITHDMDADLGTSYHGRFVAWLTELQRRNLVLGGAMTDVKGDRSRAPSEQEDPDAYVRVVERREDGVVIRGAKAHQTGAINSHWMLVMPTMRLGEADRDYAIVCAVPVEAPGITYVYGRQSCDTRSMAGGIDAGNERFSGQESLVVFDDVFVPTDHVFMDGEHGYAAELVERFTGYHRRSYVCKSGVGDVLIGAAALLADYNGVPNASHIRDKLAEMIHLNETIYGTGIAASHHSTPNAAGNWEPDLMLANVCKQNVTRFPYELGRLAQDIAGGAVATLPSAADVRHPELAEMLDKYLRGRADVPTEHRLRALRLVENMTMGRNAVGYLTESLHGAGSPQAQRIVIRRAADLEEKKGFARRLAGIEDQADAPGT
ncbi:MAG: 4-hydroxyphenylacetate 3-hydroxylase N-terminal domain-containing protein [Acidimicrobiia bacterium]|nr:4-hydroxyphenylacetate 3-hydroxylase N-terminal domain-containing protein [Acidimicrobiia bacterium]